MARGTAELKAWRARAAAHRCHARGCIVHVEPRLFMCRRHWFMLPKLMRDALWAEYVPGQEERLDPSPAYLRTARQCVEFIATKEVGEAPPEAASATLFDGAA